MYYGTPVALSQSPFLSSPHLNLRGDTVRLGMTLGKIRPDLECPSDSDLGSYNQFNVCFLKAAAEEAVRKATDSSNIVL
ncbi:hypothetical protein X975_23467, partial [Stegodyphus mimosarum]